MEALLALVGLALAAIVGLWASANSRGKHRERTRQAEDDRDALSAFDEAQRDHRNLPRAERRRRMRERALKHRSGTSGGSDRGDSRDGG